MESELFKSKAEVVTVFLLLMLHEPFFLNVRVRVWGWMYCWSYVKDTLTDRQG